MIEFLVRWTATPIVVLLVLSLTLAFAWKYWTEFIEKRRS